MARRIALVIALGIAGAAAALLLLFHYPISLTNPVEVTIRRGESTKEIAASLDDSGLLRSRRLFRWWAALRGFDRDLHPGRYKFEGKISMSDLLDSLRNRAAVVVRVTIPEGWTIAEMAPYLADQLGFDSASFVAVTGDRALLSKYGVPNHTLEGYLLPDTYEFYWGVEATDVVARMADAMAATLNDTLRARIKELGWSVHEALTLASMIEAEATVEAEHPRISAVFHNRLRTGMLLQCDPTVIYGMGGLPDGRPLLRGDLDHPSPYNTYINPGLPPGPIGNPGVESIRAALYPDSTDEYYFVADGAGGHIFTRSLDEHNNARVTVKRRQNGR